MASLTSVNWKKCHIQGSVILNDVVLRWLCGVSQSLALIVSLYYTHKGWISDKRRNLSICPLLQLQVHCVVLSLSSFQSIILTAFLLVLPSDIQTWSQSCVFPEWIPPHLPMSMIEWIAVVLNWEWLHSIRCLITSAIPLPDKQQMGLKAEVESRHSTAAAPRRLCLIRSCPLNANLFWWWQVCTFEYVWVDMLLSYSRVLIFLLHFVVLLKGSSFIEVITKATCRTCHSQLKKCSSYCRLCTQKTKENLIWM